MKTSIKLFLLSVLAVACFSACQKTGLTDINTGKQLTLSKSIVKLGEPLYITALGSTNSIVKWAVKPSANSVISTGAGTSVILFSHPGTYVVTASFFSDTLTPPYDSTSTTVNVNDSVYNDSSVVHCNVIGVVPIDSNDQITITPVSYSDTGLVMLANTQVTYNSSPNLSYLLPPVFAGEYEFIFNTITEFPCNASNGPSPATAVLSMGALTPGSHPVIFSLHGINYEGSVLVTGTQCSFTWPYTSGVVISPLTISK